MHTNTMYKSKGWRISMTEKKIPRATAKRLPLYYRYLKYMSSIAFKMFICSIFIMIALNKALINIIFIKL